MTRYALVLKSQEDRRRAIKYIESAPWGTRVELKATRRSVPQNSLMWSLLTDIAEQVPWCGMRLRPDDFKILFMAALKQELRVVPNLQGNGVVQLGRSSSDLSKSEMTALIEYIIMWGTERNVNFKLLPMEKQDDAGRA